MKVRKYIKIAGFLCLLMLAMCGMGLPIPMFNRDRFSGNKFYEEQVDEKKSEKGEEISKL